MENFRRISDKFKENFEGNFQRISRESDTETNQSKEDNFDIKFCRDMRRNFPENEDNDKAID